MEWENKDVIQGCFTHAHIRMKNNERQDKKDER